MSETLYIKRGRKYVVWGGMFDSDKDTLRVGEFRLAYCYTDGGRRYTYSVTPDTASFVAAAEVAAEAMERSIAQRTEYVPEKVPYTAKQREILDRYTTEMRATGAFLPLWWTGSTARDIAQAGVDAVRNYKP